MQPPFEITQDILDKHIDKLLDIIEEVPKQKLTILVGANGAGKSLIRKQLNVRFIKETGKRRNVVRQISMQSRTESRPDLSALSQIMHDSPEDPTSIATWHLIQEAMGRREFTKEEPYYLVFDEMEIGMSKESILGMVDFVKQKLPEWLENTLGVMVITHSNLVAKELYDTFDAAFFDIRYNEINKDFTSWLNRDIIPTDFTWLNEWSLKLYHKINERSKPMGEV